ncbi:RNA-binding region-containing protein 3 [Bufo gargarizans]|uniref:RNA-binding region-containing protein 3 n=1 Tax=Bufo gargarizans TaxID=30331 RepID=UPI001CF52924|nr:RNA-binding region-containing protein 3 [Bufo gargarizans]XP_044157437.1 RNA-binding region-containing protein 3 [Bufo gargarizans]
MDSMGRKTLLVRHLPAELSPEERRELLEKSGAESVRLCYGRTRGSLKHGAFATYPNEYAAAKALSVLHQLQVLGHTLVVEYAKEDDVHLPDQPACSEKKKSSGEKADEKKDSKPPDQVSIERGIAPTHGLVFPIRSSLKYLYPPPTSTVLANIANALASVPKFYVQVLHLMNKMNLPSPFGPLTAQPPLHADYLAMPSPYPPVPPDLPENPPLPELDDDYDMDVSSREESEYESGEEEEKERTARLLKELAGMLPKRPRIKKQSRPRKKMKIKDLITVPAVQHSQPHAPLLPSEVFEQPSVIRPKKMELHIPADITTATDAINSCLETKMAPEGNGEIIGFGKIYPVNEPNDEEENEEDDDDLPKEFISRRELEKGRLSKEETRKHSVFKNYEPGEPNCRLYVKNLSKQVTEKDLKFIFGKFIDFSSDTEKNMFDIRLMTEGRMKGQAFIGFPNEDVAAKALKHTHGYVLCDKPMVIQFARSARPKPVPDKTQTKR